MNSAARIFHTMGDAKRELRGNKKPSNKRNQRCEGMTDSGDGRKGYCTIPDS